MLANIKWKVSNKNRESKYKIAKKFIKNGDSILDIGVDPTLSFNTNYFEKMYDIDNKLSCLGV